MKKDIQNNGLRIKEIAVSERPRERLIKHGVKSLSNAELLAVIISCGTRKESALTLAQRLLSLEEGNLLHLSAYMPEEFERIDGIGEATACKIAAAIEFGKRVSCSTIGNEYAGSPDDIVRFCEDLRHEHQEYFRIVLINAKSIIIGKDDISIGGLSSAYVNPREVFASAIRKGAAGVVLVHNHPSGDPTPSKQDIELTKSLTQSGRLLSIVVYDHVIIGDGRFYSFKANNLVF